MFVGVGAARVRDLFEKAKHEAPAIIFVDELDAVGRSRAAGGNISGSHDEREQTLNQILTEMDGFDPRAGIIVIAATNRPEILDPALLRPGRFDRHVAVAPPDRDGREQILRVHTRALPLAADVDLGALAAQTPGMVGADLANLANEAALTAARRDRDCVAMRDFNDALERIMLGAERRSLLSPEDRRRIAYHEGGHAIVGMRTPLADPVRKVTIIPHGQALGVTLSVPDTDKFNYPKAYPLAEIRVALGGRVAEELVFGDITTGAESDIEQLTQIARQMVGRSGMSEKIGPIAMLPADATGPPLPGMSEVSPDTQRDVDREVRRLVEEARVEVRTLLTTNRDRLDALAAALLEHETLDEREAYAAAGLAPPRILGAAASRLNRTSTSGSAKRRPSRPAGRNPRASDLRDGRAGRSPLNLCGWRPRGQTMGTLITCVSVRASSPSRPSSRPTPLWLKPPNGARSSTAVAL